MGHRVNAELLTAQRHVDLYLSEDFVNFLINLVNSHLENDEPNLETRHVATIPCQAPTEMVFPRGP